MARAMRASAGDGGVAHPDLLAGPAFERGAGACGLTKQRPLRAISDAAGVRQVRRHVPPLDAEFRMRAVIGRKRKTLAGHHSGKSIRRLAKSGKALRKGLAAEQRERAASKAAAGNFAATVHWQKS